MTVDDQARTATGYQASDLDGIWLMCFLQIK